MTTTVTPIHATLWDWLCAIFFWIPAWVWFALTLRHELREDRALMVHPVAGPPSPSPPPLPIEDRQPESKREPATDFTAEVMGAIALADFTAKLASQEPREPMVQSICPLCRCAEMEHTLAAERSETSETTTANGGGGLPAKRVLRIPGKDVPVKLCAHHRRARRLARDRATLAGEFVTKLYFVEPPSRASLN